MDYNHIKSHFNTKLSDILNENIKFKHILLDIFVYGSAYVVGGFLRDIFNNKSSRDIDIIVDLDHNRLIDIIINSGIEYSINRHNGIKIGLKNIQVDLWSIENNWAFRNDLVKLDEERKLDSIAKGCFYNYDSLVINIHDRRMNVKFYKEFMKTRTLDILQKVPLYKNLNPTKEANILRAFYLRKELQANFSYNTKKYLLTKIGEIKDMSSNPIDALVNVKKNYPKYDSVLTDFDIKLYILELINNNEINNQYFLKF